MTMTQFEESTGRLSPRVNVALSRTPRQKLPERVRGFSISSKSTNVNLLTRCANDRGSPASAAASLAVPEVTRRRTDQFRDFVRMLKLGAIDLCDQVGVAKRTSEAASTESRLARACRPKEEQRPDRAARVSRPARKI